MHGSKTQKKMKRVAQDVLAMLYATTVQIRSGFASEGEVKKRQADWMRSLVGKHGINDLVGACFHAFAFVASTQENRRIVVQLGSEQLMLAPFFDGIDEYMNGLCRSYYNQAKMDAVNTLEVGLREEAKDFLGYVPSIELDVSVVTEGSSGAEEGSLTPDESVVKPPR